MSSAAWRAFLLGELSAIYTITQYAFLLTLWGLVWTAIGWRGVKVLWAGLVFLVFMIPLPDSFSSTCQTSSSCGPPRSARRSCAPSASVSILEGNVIDLGTYKLQVVEACSGLRYLFPLMSFAFFCAYIFRGRLWQKLVIFAPRRPSPSS